MKKNTINLYFDMEFTSLSPDAQIISIGIVSDDRINNSKKHPVGIVGWDRISAFELARKYKSKFASPPECVLLFRPEHIKGYVFGDIILPNEAGNVEGYNISQEMQEAIKIASKEQLVKHTSLPEKSFYAEFTDFDINRCDDWVKENVVGKLKYYNIPDNKEGFSHDLSCISIPGNTISIKKALKEWLSQFSDYDIQFVVDCGTFDWYWMLQLLDERERMPFQIMVNSCAIPPNMTLADFIEEFRKSPVIITEKTKSEVITWHQTGLPKLPSNISPVPQDLNDLIAYKHGLTPKEAFEINREFEWSPNIEVSSQIEFWGKSGKHNALWDAKVIKTIYQTLTK